jgi:hypothetical protein
MILMRTVAVERYNAEGKEKDSAETERFRREEEGAGRG